MLRKLFEANAAICMVTNATLSTYQSQTAERNNSPLYFTPTCDCGIVLWRTGVIFLLYLHFCPNGLQNATS